MRLIFSTLLLALPILADRHHPPHPLRRQIPSGIFLTTNRTNGTNGTSLSLNTRTSTLTSTHTLSPASTNTYTVTISSSSSSHSSSAVTPTPILTGESAHLTITTYATDSCDGYPISHDIYYGNHYSDGDWFASWTLSRYLTVNETLEFSTVPDDYQAVGALSPECSKLVGVFGGEDKGMGIGMGMGRGEPGVGYAYHGGCMGLPWGRSVQVSGVF